MMRLFVILAVVAGGLAQTCPVGQGWQPGADTEAVALSRMVGTFLPIRYTNNHVAPMGFLISAGDVGLLTDRGGAAGTGDGSDFGNYAGASSFRLVVAGGDEDTVQDPNFPGDQGWFFTRCMYGCSSWQYNRVVAGVLESHSFSGELSQTSTDPGSGSVTGIPSGRYCCTGTGPRVTPEPSVSAATAGCRVCPTGTYSDTDGATGCQSCPAGTYSRADAQPGARNVTAACSACPAGTEFAASAHPHAGLYRPVSYTNRHVSTGGFVITRTGLIHDVTLHTGVEGSVGPDGESGEGSGGYFRIVPAHSAQDDVKDPNYPASEGWFFVRCVYGCSHWQYDRVRNGEFVTNTFAPLYPFTNRSPEGSPHWCCTGRGPLVEGTDDALAAAVSRETTCTSCPPGFYSAGGNSSCVSAAAAFANLTAQLTVAMTTSAQVAAQVAAQMSAQMSAQATAQATALAAANSRAQAALDSVASMTSRLSTAEGQLSQAQQAAVDVAVQLGDLAAVVSSAALTAVTLPLAGTPQRCSGGSCAPSIQARGDDLAIKAARGKVTLSSDECGTVDLCEVVLKLDETVQALSNLGN